MIQCHCVVNCSVLLKANLSSFNASAGNLGRVDYISEFEFDLFIRPDTCNPRFRVWFNFTVENVRETQVSMLLSCMVLPLISSNLNSRKHKSFALRRLNLCNQKLSSVVFSVSVLMKWMHSETLVCCHWSGPTDDDDFWIIKIIYIYILNSLY